MAVQILGNFNVILTKIYNNLLPDFIWNQRRPLKIFF